VPTSGALADQVKADFGSFENLKKEVNTKTAAVQGSGWGWLGFNKGTKKLEVVTTANQDPLLSESSRNAHTLEMLTGLAHVPIIGIDIWEHAFYLQYKNVKPDVSWLILAVRSAADETVLERHLGRHQLQGGRGPTRCRSVDVGPCFGEIRQIGSTNREKMQFAPTSGLRHHFMHCRSNLTSPNRFARCIFTAAHWLWSPMMRVPILSVR
jgi:hypothetical protein